MVNSTIPDGPPPGRRPGGTLVQLSPGSTAPVGHHAVSAISPAPACTLVTGSGGPVPSELAAIVTTVDLPVRIGDQEVDPHRDGALGDFYARLRAGELAETSTTPPGAFLSVFRDSPAERVLCLTIPAQWSGMDDSARLAARMLAGEEGRERVTVIDAGTAAAGLGLITRVAALRALRGASFDEVVERARAAIEDVRMFGALENLEFVARSGRINSLLAGISDSLHVRPVFRLSNGQTGRVALTRTRSGVLSALERTARELPRQLWVLVFHADAPDLAARLEEQLRQSCDVARCEIVALDPIIGTHTGPGAVGYAALPLRDDEVGEPVR
jgi:DegV family protein with EDD domain